MITLFTSISLIELIINKKKEGLSIGFVPTMGALHQGHLNLIKIAKQTCDYVVCSIFVNPKQFNDIKDLEKYPRTIENDAILLTDVGCDLLFFPTVSEIYSNDWHRTDFDFGWLAQTMEGKFRIGHFDGMAQVVNRLLQIVQPEYLFMGQKDFQQQAIVKELIAIQKFKVKLVCCNTTRENDGLAMSSRNTRLNNEERNLAPIIYQTLSQLSVLKYNILPNDYCNWAINVFQKHKNIRVEYVSVVAQNTLKDQSYWNPKTPMVCCVALWLGETRLIDNVYV
jgi:pantoate--beta-alanine ligase